MVWVDAGFIGQEEPGCWQLQTISAQPSCALCWTDLQEVGLAIICIHAVSTLTSNDIIDILKVSSHYSPMMSTEKLSRYQPLVVEQEPIQHVTQNQ